MGSMVVVEKRKRRSRGQRGSIVKSGSGYIAIYRTPEGKQKWESGFRRKEDAQSRLDAVLGEIRRGRYVEPSGVLFSKFCASWMEYSKAVLKPRTWIGYESALKNWITPTFGQTPLCEIYKSDVVDFLHGLLKNADISRKFVKNVHILVHRLFEAALEKNLISANPADKIKLPVAQEFGAALSVERVVPTPAEVVMTLQKLTPTFQAILVTSAMTGLRRGELLGLQWQDVDWQRRKIKIQRTLQRIPKRCMDSEEFRGVERIGNSGLAIVPPKSKKSVRSVDIPMRVTDVLSTLRENQVDSELPFVFRNEIGNPIDPDSIHDILNVAQAGAGVRRFGLHGLRHLYCSLLQETGAPLKFAQEKLGHANASTTMDVYTHTVNDQSQMYAEKVESAFPALLN